MTKPIKKVAIIGAGPSGLAQLKNLLEVSKLPSAKYELQVTVYESKPDVGGVWYSTEEPKHYKRAIVPNPKEGEGKGKERMYIYPPGDEEPSPMYEGLRTNLPHELMAFRDFPFPPETPLFPDRKMVHKYFQDYATHFNLWTYIRFNTRVERLYNLGNTTSGLQEWVIESKDGKEGYHHVCVGNGHYEDGWIPDIPGLSHFSGEILHSIYYLRPEDYTHRKVLIVGSFASGSDLARQLASLNLPPSSSSSSTSSTSPKPTSPHGLITTTVYVSCSTPPTTIDPWTPYISYYPLISHTTTTGTIVFQSTSSSSSSTSTSPNPTPTLEDVDTIIFATGYNFSLPFCKITDYPWSDPSYRVLDEVIHLEEREGGREIDQGGIKGLCMDTELLDGSMIFLRNDEGRGIAFPTLQYQIVPFPLVETQTRLTSLLWSGSLTLPNNLKPPSNPSNPYDTSSQPSNSTMPPRKTAQIRKKLVFGASYEFEYQEWLISLMGGVGDDVGWRENWWSKQGIKRGWREDTTLRRRTLGY